jgi:hypothetical protein
VVCPGADSDNEHLEADVQNVDVSLATYNFTFLLITSIRKKAGALDQVDSRSSGGGMTPSMKKRAKDALAGRTGETDDEDN